MKTKSNIDLNQFTGGALAEQVKEALGKIAENIMDPNTDPEKKRKMTVTMSFTPGKNRRIANTKIQVTTALAPTDSIDTQIVMGRDFMSDRIEVGELNDQIPGQMELQYEQEEQEEKMEPIDLRNANVVNMSR